MKLVCTMPVRNEAWVLGLSARAVLQWCDELVILDHASTDGSRDIEADLCARYGSRIAVLHDDDPVWFECAHRQRLLEAARGRGATHVALVDADEILTGNLLDSIRGIVREMPGFKILQLPWVCLARSIDRYYASGIWFHNWVTTAFLDSPEAHWKAQNGYDFHHRHPMGKAPLFDRPLLESEDPASHAGGLMHLQFVSERRLRAKQALYKMTEVLRWPGREPLAAVNARYDLAIYQSDPQRIATSAVPLPWFRAAYGHWLQYLNPDAEPWQEAECRRLWREHGPARFAGLDLFGVVA